VSWSIRARLSLSYSALVLAVLATATAVIAGVESRSSLARLDAELQRLNLTVGAVMLNEFGEGLDLSGAALEASTEVVTPGRILSIADQDRSIVRAWGGIVPPSWRPDAGSIGADASSVTLNGANYRMVGRRVVANGHAFVVLVLAAMAPLEELDVSQVELFTSDTHWPYFERLRAEERCPRRVEDVRARVVRVRPDAELRVVVEVVRHVERVPGEGPGGIRRRRHGERGLLGERRHLGAGGELQRRQ